jgi:hypothetical protein
MSNRCLNRSTTCLHMAAQCKVKSKVGVNKSLFLWPGCPHQSLMEPEIKYTRNWGAAALDDFAISLLDASMRVKKTKPHSGYSMDICVYFFQLFCISLNSILVPLWLVILYFSLVCQLYFLICEYCNSYFWYPVLHYVRLLYFSRWIFSNIDSASILYP